MDFDLNLPGEEENNPREINSFDVNKVVQANIIYLNKKRKFQAEETDLPLLKHKFRDRNLVSDYDYPLEDTLIKNDYEIHILKEKADNEPTNETELKSFKDSNNTNIDDMDYSSASIFNETKTVSYISISIPNTYPTLSASNGRFSSYPYSVESGSKLPKNVGDCVYDNNDFGINTCMDYDESLLEFGCDLVCVDSEENKSNGTEQCKEKEIEDMLYSNGMPKNYMLSSEKWKFNQENQEGTKKTIDKEFEEYFSMLML